MEAQHDSASNLHSPVPSFMASLLPQVSQSALAVQVVVLVFQRISTDRPAHLLHTLHVCCERLVSCSDGKQLIMCCMCKGAMMIT
jgi:hypothetical protein